MVRTLAGAAGIESDEFNSSTLNSAMWTFVNPLGDASVSMTGTQVELAVPAGTSHDLWNTTATVARLLQTAPNGDFEVELKWDTAPSAATQLQGLVVVQDNDDLLRIETHFDGNRPRVFVGRIAGGVGSSIHFGNLNGSGGPIYFRLKREGNSWTLSTSRNGTSWNIATTFTQSLAVSAIGPFVGNQGSPAPAFASRLDYFRVIGVPPPADVTPPTNSGVGVSAGAVAATVSWSTNEPATSQVSYGTTTAYGSTAGPTGLRTAHQVTLSGLQCATLYHFQIQSRDAANNTATTADSTFTAAACPGQIRSDEFNLAALDTNIWSFVNPLGDGTVVVNGGRASIGVPAGVAHDIWSGVNTVPRLVQGVPNSDFEVEVKFDSAVTTGYQQQGIVVEQDADDLLRLEFHHDGGGTWLFAAAVTAGTASTKHFSAVTGGAPKYLRVKRVGNTWTLRHSSDGATWSVGATFTQALTVRGIGPFAGNGGSSPPAFTSVVDYFREVLPDLTAPIVTGVAVTPGPISARVAWTTNEAASSAVAYGPTSAYEFGTASLGGTRTSHSVLVHGLRCATTYRFQVRSADVSGNLTSAPDATFTTSACPASLTSDEFASATLNQSLWTLVNPLGDGTATANGSQAILSVPAGTRHDLWTGVDEVPRLLQATPDGPFEVEVKFDSAVTSRYQMQGLFVQQDPLNLLRIEVNHDGSGAYLFVAGLTNGNAAVIHERSISGAAPTYLRLKRKGSTWTLRHSNDGNTWTTTSFDRALAVAGIGPYAGNSGGSPPAFSADVDYFRSFPPDVTAPVLTGIAAAPSPIGATVTWATNEPATSAVAYGLSSAYTGGTVSVAGERSTHSVFLHGLQCATTYHYQVRSADTEGNLAASTDRTFVTGACPTELTSDEFNAATLNTGLWSFFNPLNDSTATANGSQAVISVPAGVAHDVWTTSDTVPRLLQAAPNANFEVEAKFTSAVTIRYQQQGIMVEQDPNNLLRIEVHSEGTETKLFVAAIMGATADIKYNAAVPAGANTYLQVKRVGTRWTVRYSTDGETWPISFAFDQAFVARAIGPFAGNGGSLPAFAANVDYFRVVPPPPPDLTPPTLTSIAALTHRASATVTWSTNELATSQVEWGLTASYGPPPAAAGSLTAQRARLTGLACATTYHYRVRSTDGAGNVAVSTDRTFTTAACGAAPSIVVWRGSPQIFGSVGVPQRWINVLGSVEDPTGIASLTYRLNAGPSLALSVGPSDDRLAHAGDFNIELFYGDLLPGLNAVEITATDTAGNSTVHVVQVDWQGNTNTQPPTNGPVLVVVAHPDDEALGMAGVIRQAKAAGRRVYVAVVTNGDSITGGSATGYCGAAAGTAATTAQYGLRRDGETVSAMSLLGLQRTPSLLTTEIIFLGYPGNGLEEIAASGTGWTGDPTGLHRTYAEDADGSISTCNGDFRYLRDGVHSVLSAGALSADLDALLQITTPSDIYTHNGTDAHTDHVKVWSSLTAAIIRNETNVRVHSTLIHPEDSGPCQLHAAAVWPNPALVNNNPFARFTPAATFTAPPAPICDPNATGTSWGSAGAPNESVTVPAAMQTLDEATNLKWRAIAQYQSQIDCTQDGGEYHVNCGYMRAFVKRNEFFWTRLYSPIKRWPQTYTANWTSTPSIDALAQIFEGQWTHDGTGIRPVATGFDRVITLGDIAWKDYEVTAEVTFNSFDQSRPVVGSAVGLALGWQGHSDWGQPRFGHPSGGLCLYAWDGSEPLYNKVQLGYSPGPAHDTVLAKQYTDLPVQVRHLFRFRQRDLGNGSTRYSCKVWRSGQAEPSAWTLEADVPHWPGETQTRRGSVVLVAHHADATFGTVAVAPVGG